MLTAADIVRYVGSNPLAKPTITEPSTYELAILNGLQDKHPIYQGTVPGHTIRARRKRNKAARAARRANRG